MPRYGVAQLDPVWTTDTATRALALQVFESLYSVDERLNPQPQVAAGHQVDEDDKRWTITLRDGLRFHDGEPVRARDCVASINRWMKRDAVAAQSLPTARQELGNRNHNALAFLRLASIRLMVRKICNPV